LPTQHNYASYDSQNSGVSFPSSNWLDFVMQSCLWGKVVPVLNYLSTTSSRHLGEWMHSSNILYLSITWRRVFSFTPRQIYPAGKSPLIPIGYEAAWIPEAIWTLSKFSGSRKLIFNVNQQIHSWILRLANTAQSLNDILAKDWHARSLVLCPLSTDFSLFVLQSVNIGPTLQVPIKIFCDLCFTFEINNKWMANRQIVSPRLIVCMILVSLGKNIMQICHKYSYPGRDLNS
jgi:hypothetical protein